MKQSRVAIVTGAGRGIGEGIAERLFAEGYRLVLSSTDGRTAAALAGRLGAPDRICVIAADIGAPDQARALVAGAIDAFGQVDILVNNAGVPSLQKFLDVTVEEWNRVLAVNLTGAMVLSQAAAKDMIGRRWGRIVNIASVVGVSALGGRTAYGVAKAGMIHMTRQIAIELAPFGVTVNAVAPGVTETDMTRNSHTPEMRAAFNRNVPAGRYGETREIAEAVAFFAHENASYVTGQTLNIDGGLTVALAYAGASVK